MAAFLARAFSLRGPRLPLRGWRRRGWRGIRRRSAGRSRRALRDPSDPVEEVSSQPSAEDDELPWSGQRPHVLEQEVAGELVDPPGPGGVRGVREPHSWTCVHTAAYLYGSV